MKISGLALLALVSGGLPASANDAALRNWNTYYVFGMNMGPNKGYAQQRSNADAATDRQQTGGSGRQSTEAAANPSVGRAGARQQRPR